MRDDQNPKKLNDIGEAYFTGLKMDKNIEIAYSYFKQAADQQNPIGYYNVSRYFVEKGDYKEAVINLQKSLSLGYSKAALLLAEMALDGVGMHKSKSKAFKYVSEAASQNDIDGYNILANYHMKGIGTKKDPKKAWEYFQKSADMGNTEGMYQLGVLFLSAKQNQKNMESALHWLDKAATHLHKEAILTIKKLYDTGHSYFSKKSVSHLKEMSFYYEELLARTNDIPSLRNVSLTYYHGSSITKSNYEKAFHYFQILEKLHDEVGAYGMGLCYLYAKGTPQDVEKASELLKYAAMKNYPNALTKLGDIERSDALHPANYEAAKDYYFEAAKQNDSEALMNLGLLHYRNQILSSTNDLAYQYMEQSSAKGNNQAYYWLGIFHEKGIGTKQSINLAEKAFEKAIDAGNIGAKFKYASLLFEEVKKSRKPSKKQLQTIKKALSMFLEYLNDSDSSSTNRLFSMAYIAEAFSQGLGVKKSDRAARYWTERAASAGLSSHMLIMYQLLKDQEFENAYAWLQKAIKQNDLGEAYYELGNLYFDGTYGFEKDEKKARNYYETSAKMKCSKAVEKLMMI